MSMNCDIILRWSAKPEQLAAVGYALWRWCNHTAGAAGIYRYLDNQALADLIAGKLPDSSQTAWRADPRGLHFSFQGEASHDREATSRRWRGVSTPELAPRSRMPVGSAPSEPGRLPAPRQLLTD